MVEYDKERRDANGLRIGRIGHCDWDLVTNAMIWSPGLYSIFRQNPYGTETLGLTHFLKWFQADDRPNATNLIWLALDSRQLQEGRYRIAHATGVIQNVSLLAEPALNERGEAVRMCLTLVELTETT